jgi:hypothetical protein
MFIIFLAVVALTDYVITVYCIVNLVAKPAGETAEPPRDISDGSVMGYISIDKEFIDHIEEQNARIAHLSFKVNEILSNIDSIIEGNKVKQSVAL